MFAKVKHRLGGKFAQVDPMSWDTTPAADELAAEETGYMIV